MTQEAPKQPIFSILTVTKNNRTGLQKTAISIKAQTLPTSAVEWIIADGGSGDSSLDIYELSGLVTKILPGPDAGIFDGMNKALAISNGTYVLFLNAGDALADRHTLSDLHHLIEKHKPCFIYGDAWEEECGSRHYKSARHHHKAALGMFTHHQACLYHGDIARTLRYDLQYPIAADYDFTLRFLKIASVVHYTAQPLCIYEAGGISQLSRKQGRAEQFEIRKNLKICADPINRVIVAGQIANAALRAYVPGFYWRAKGRSRG